MMRFMEQTLFRKTRQLLPVLIRRVARKSLPLFGIIWIRLSR
jgi:hypothetical protein